MPMVVALFTQDGNESHASSENSNDNHFCFTESLKCIPITFDKDVKSGQNVIVTEVLGENGHSRAASAGNARRGVGLMLNFEKNMITDDSRKGQSRKRCTRALGNCAATIAHTGAIDTDAAYCVQTGSPQVSASLVLGLAASRSEPKDSVYSTSPSTRAFGTWRIPRSA
jgi:hypothetical protein